MVGCVLNSEILVGLQTLALLFGVGAAIFTWLKSESKSESLNRKDIDNLIIKETQLRDMLTELTAICVRNHEKLTEVVHDQSILLAKYGEQLKNIQTHIDR